MGYAMNFLPISAILSQLSSYVLPSYVYVIYVLWMASLLTGVPFKFYNLKYFSTLHSICTISA